MKLSVIGAGAIGSLFGGLIQCRQPAAEVQLIVRGRHGDAIQRHGSVLLEGPWGRREVAVAATSEVAAIAGSDVVLLTVKSHDTRTTIESARPYLGNAVVVSIQNGINDDVLSACVSPAKLVMGMTAINAATIQPGHVSLQLNGCTVIGPAADGGNRVAVDTAAQLLRQSGLQVTVHPDARGVRYSKLALNAVGYASCLTPANFISDCVCNSRWRRDVGAPVLDECLQTFALAGVEVADIPGRPGISQLQRLFQLMEMPLVGRIVQQGARWRYNGKPIVFSLYQDLRRGKGTEVEHVNGYIANMAAAHGAAAPCNTCVVTLVKELENRPGTFFDLEQVLRRFRQARSLMESRS